MNNKLVGILTIIAGVSLLFHIIFKDTESLVVSAAFWILSGVATYLIKI